MNFTKEQQKVIDIRGSNVLVSAAAGSGKTAVIVERVIGRVIKDRADISQMLIVTFTKAASGEMKDRIRDAFEEKLDSIKDDRELALHLERQLSLIFDAPVMTIDSFCLDVIRNNFNILGIDPSFRVGDEGELKMIRADVMEELLEDHYRDGEESDFYGFLERFSVKKDDSDVASAIMQLHDFAVSRPDPKGFLENAAACYVSSGEADIRDNAIVLEVAKRSLNRLKSYKKALLRAEEIALMPEGPSAYLTTLNDDLEILDNLIAKKGYEELLNAFRTVSFGKLSPKKNDGEDPALRAKAKGLRDSVKKGVETLGKRYFYSDFSGIAGEFAALKKDASVLAMLTEEYLDRFLAAKKKKNIVDFSDVEHLALEILKDKDVRNRYKDAYIEIIIDEYQDSNRLQEEIFGTLATEKKAYFCVGDVKQSIYSFRDACPELFTDKYERYGKGDGEEGTLLLLARNFRSRKSVLDAVNGLFRNIMHASAGSVEYDEDQYLNFGELYKREIEDDTAEYILAFSEDPGENDKDELEAHMIAKKIGELVGNFDIEDKKTGELRKCSYKDIVILMRALKGRDEKFMNVLLKMGIPVSTDSSAGYLMTDEIRSIINLLCCIDNPIQDIPLAGTCLSIFGGFDESELALIRAALPEKELFFALKAAAEEDCIDPVIRQKAESFLNKLERYRHLASFIPIHELLSVIINDHAYDNYVRALNDGSMRLKNLNMLLYRASEFEKTSLKGLFRFIRYLEYIKKYEIDINPKTGGTDHGDTVRIMSIHHSKGLEFPVVFLSGMHRTFNRKDISERLLIDDRLGAGMDLIDINKRLKKRTLSKSVVADRKKEALFGEELRVLYVAMTRAEQKLIMTGIAKQAPAEDGKASVLKKIPADHTETDSYGGLLEYALETDESLKSYIKCSQVSEKELVFEELDEKRDLQFEREDLLRQALSVDDERIEKLKKDLSARYPYTSVLSAPGKLSVSELKHEAMEEKGVDLIRAIEEKTDNVPGFISGLKTKAGGPVRGAIRGTAYHTVFEKLIFEKASDRESVRKQILKMEEEGRLTKDEVLMIDADDIVSFVNSPLGARMTEAEKNGKLFREQPFVILVKASVISDEYPDDEKVMVQGVIDSYFEEDGKIVVVDYKTDRVENGRELEDRYKTQLDYYAKALTQLTGIEVLEKILYSVTLGEVIVVQ